MIGMIHRDYTTGYSVFVVDTVDELAKLPTTSNEGKDNLSTIKGCSIGSKATVTATSDRYILNDSDEWVVDKNAGGGGSGDYVVATSDDIKGITDGFLA